jgi:hypothetical protein
MQVVKILKGDDQTLELVKQCQQSKLQRTYLDELFDAEEYNPTKTTLNDLDRHMETVLGVCNDV